jgi:predicted acylesterase/phospholipase RssA
MLKKFFALSLVIVVTGCTTTPVYNQRLTQFSPDSGYRFKNIEKKENSDDLFVILTFSGGGTRASALSLGVLEKLAATEIEWNGRKCRLLDEVDLISGVSGGSFTAAYYGAFGDRVFTDFTEKLYRKNNSTLLKAAFSLPNMIKQASPLYSRTDTTANNYSTKVFEGMTFGDLLAKRERPFILLNATDMGLGRQFSFTQNYFDLLYSDLSTYPLGNAVAASSAFPGAFTSLLVKNHEKGPDFKLDPWFQAKLDRHDLGSFQYRTARDFAAYADPAKKFAHLSDGGVSDNLGLLPIIGALSDPEQPLGLVPTIPQGKEQKIVIIAVNAASRPPDTLSYKGKPPGLFKILGRAGTTPMGWFTEAQLAYLKLLIGHAESIDAAKPGETPDPSTNAARLARSEAPRHFYFTEVGFDKIADDEERKFFETIPTSFTLVPESVDKLRKIGGVMLDGDPVFQKLLGEIGAK